MMNQLIINEFGKVYDELIKYDSYAIRKWLMVMIDVVLNVHANNTFLNNDNDGTHFGDLIKQVMSSNIDKLSQGFNAVFMFLYLGAVDEKEVITLTKLGDNTDDVYSHQLTLTSSLTNFEELVNNYDPMMIKNFTVDFFANLYVHMASQKPEAHMSEYFYNILSSEDTSSGYAELVKYMNLSMPSFMIFNILDSVITKYYQNPMNVKALLASRKEANNTNDELETHIKDVIAELQAML